VAAGACAALGLAFAGRAQADIGIAPAVTAPAAATAAAVTEPVSAIAAAVTAPIVPASQPEATPGAVVPQAVATVRPVVAAVRRTVVTPVHRELRSSVQLARLTGAAATLVRQIEPRLVVVSLPSLAATVSQPAVASASAVARLLGGQAARPAGRDARSQAFALPAAIQVTGSPAAPRLGSRTGRSDQVAPPFALRVPLVGTGGTATAGAGAAGAGSPSPAAGTTFAALGRPHVLQRIVAVPYRPRSHILLLSLERPD
jgi:hypothetical protein